VDVIADMNRFSIRDIENLTGIKAHTLRIWEQRYGILQPKRTPTNIRFYDALDLKTALRISLLNQYGYKISRIHRMGDEEMNNLISKINDSEFRLQLLVNELLEATLAIDIDHFEELVDLYLKKYGIEQTIEQLVFNFLEKIGIMWMTDRIFPAQEHLISHVIYRKLALAIEQLPKYEHTSPAVLLFLPEGEIHDIGLMYINYLLKKHKKKTIYLGPNTPFNDVELVHNAKMPEYLYVHLTSVTTEFDCSKYLHRLSSTFPNSTIYASGGMLKHHKVQPKSNLKFLHTLHDARNIIPSL
jgi:MerR family transcriptional regulator, light-induced transcriptional regulator